MIMVVTGVMSMVIAGRGMRIGCRMGSAKWHGVSMHVAAILFIADGVSAPISMPSFPVMESCHAGGIQSQPDVVRPKIIILVAHHPDVFVAIPNIRIRNPHIHGSDGYY